jgi:uncharacterized protein with HEPN domain
LRRDPKALLWDAHRASEAIVAMLSGKTFEQFDADIVLHSAVERQFEIVGEALAQLARANPAIAAQIPQLSDAVAFRKLLIHGYAVIDRRRVWEIVNDDLPSLRVTLSEILARN